MDSYTSHNSLSNEEMLANIRKLNIVLFDGVCNLCNGTINMLIDRDKEDKLHFSSLQSPIGQWILKHYNMPTDSFNSFIFLKKGSFFQKSNGALEVLLSLNAPPLLIQMVRFLPIKFRDKIYDYVAENRYRWFGEKDACRMPDAHTKAKLLHEVSDLKFS